MDHHKRNLIPISKPTAASPFRMLPTRIPPYHPNRANGRDTLKMSVPQPTSVDHRAKRRRTTHVIISRKCFIYSLMPRLRPLLGVSLLIVIPLSGLMICWRIRVRPMSKMKRRRRMMRRRRRRTDNNKISYQRIIYMYGDMVPIVSARLKLLVVLISQREYYNVNVCTCPYPP